MPIVSYLKQYTRCFQTGNFIPLYDILAADFHFKNPRFEILGRDNYINYVTEFYLGYASESLFYKKIDENVFVHVYDVIAVNSLYAVKDMIRVTETITLKDMQICSTDLKYNMNDFSPQVKQNIEQFDVNFLKINQKTG